MADGHTHDHGHPSVGTDRRALTIALVLLVTFMVSSQRSRRIQFARPVGRRRPHAGGRGCHCGSLVAIRLAARPETGSHTYGMKRAEILAAAGNAIALLVVSALVTYDAVGRLVHPSPVNGTVLIVVAAVGVAVNVAPP